MNIVTGSSATDLMDKLAEVGLTLYNDIADVRITIFEDGAEKWEAIPYE